MVMKLTYILVFTVLLHNIVKRVLTNELIVKVVFRLHQYKKRSRRRELENGVRKKRSIRRERKNDTTEACLILLLLLAGDVEPNPGPVTVACTTCKQTFNRRSRLNHH